MDILTRNFFRLLRAGAFGTEEQIEPISAWKWKRIYMLSIMHHVTAVMWDGIKQCDNQFFLQLPEGLREDWEKATHEIESRSLQTTTAMQMLFNTFNQLQCRPMLVGAVAIATYYDNPVHCQYEGLDIFFPFETQGKRANDWAMANVKEESGQERSMMSYEWQEVMVSHHQKLFKLTNKLLNYSLQSIIEKDIRESRPTFITINGHRIETVSPTLTLLVLLLSITKQLLNDGLSLQQIVDLGMLLRKVGDKVDFVMLQEWIDKLHLSRMAQVSGDLLVTLFGFSTDEIPFMQANKKQDIASIMNKLFLLRRQQTGTWSFRQQGDDIFIHAANSSAMFWQVRHSARYFKYHPSESFTNLFSAFARSLTHIEE